MRKPVLLLLLYLVPCSIRLYGQASYDNSVNTINLIHARYPFLNGAGLAAAVKEDLFDTANIDFRGRIKTIVNNSTAVSAHATTIAALIGGGGNSSSAGRGAAPGVELVSTGFGSLLPDTDAYARYAISVQNHSYGTVVESHYGNEAAAYDASTITFPALLHVFSSGNSGDQAAAEGPYAGIAGFANLTGNFKQAKNVLTVGSTDGSGYVPFLSSKGPASDGRLKPELVAYGETGSSEASAYVSGIGVLLQQAWHDLHGSLPGSALVRAFLLNTADDVESKGIDFYSGYGNANAYRAMNDLVAGRCFPGTCRQGDDLTFPIQIPGHIGHLKVMLAWNDPPAAVNAATALVNDLDLQVDNSGLSWLPWVLNNTANTDSLGLLPVRGRDSLNTAEQVTLDDPAAGTYLVHVRGTSLRSEAQTFYVVYDWDTTNNFAWTFPAAHDNITGAAVNNFRWSSTYTDKTGELDYSPDAGKTWLPIDKQVDLSTGYYQWVAPDTFALAAARMTIDGQIYQSDTFSISRALSLYTGFSCTDSFLLYWNRPDGVDSFTLSFLTGNYLQPVKVSDDTFFLQSATAASSPWFSVSPLLGPGWKGVQSATIDLQDQTAGCYINSFLADLQPDSSVLLTTTLGTVFNVAAVVFEKYLSNGWQRMDSLPVGQTLVYKLTDEKLHTGINPYRTAAILSDGRKIYSNEADVDFVGNDWLLFPNPLQPGQQLHLFFKESTAHRLELYNVRGQRVMAMTVSGFSQNLDLGYLQQGMYFLKVFSGQKSIGVKKVIFLNLH